MKKGTRVIHTLYGHGTVQSTVKGQATVLFDRYGLRVVKVSELTSNEMEKFLEGFGLL